MKSGFLVRMATAASVMLLTACVHIERIDFDKNAHSNIKKIAVLRPAESHAITVRNYGGAENYIPGGAIGGAIAGSIGASHSEIFLKALNDSNIKLGPLMAASLQEEFKKQGFEVVYIENQRPKRASDGKTVDFTAIETDADAIITLSFGPTGYQSQPSSTFYTPRAQVSALLKDRRTNENLYFHFFQTPLGKLRLDNITYLSCDEGYQYESFELLMNKFDEAIKGVLACQRKAAVLIAEHLGAPKVPQSNPAAP